LVVEVVPDCAERRTETGGGRHDASVGDSGDDARNRDA
jgi:hypothetical protein